MIAGTTWEATLQKARQVYTAAVKPAMTYGAAIWHPQPGTSEAKMTHVRKLAIEQNKCLRTVLGPYKVTPTAVLPTEVLEAESSVLSFQVTLDHAVLRMQALQGIHPVTKTGNARIRKNLRKRKHNKQTRTPAEEKEQWAVRLLESHQLEESE